ncbi:MAG: BRO family protein [Thermodesulfovibrionales bacterium]
MAMDIAYLLKKRGNEPSLYTKLDSSHSFGMTEPAFGMTNNAVISNEGRNLYRQESLGYGDYRNFEGVIEKAKMACFNSGHRIEDHFADVSKMIEIGKGGRREIKVTLLSRYACYLVIQNADPNKEIVAQGQTYFAIQTRRQELTDERIEEDRRILLREEMRRHNASYLSFRPKGEISCPESIATTYTY